MTASLTKCFRTYRRFVSCLLLPALLMACEEDDGSSVPDAAALADGGWQDGAPANSPDAGGAEVANPSGAVLQGGIAVMHADVNTSSLSLLTPLGTLVKDDCLHSGTMAGPLTQALSSDVALPSQVQPGNQVVLIDRMNGTLNYVSGSTCDVLRQISVATGFNANPHDVVGLSESKAYVSRYDQNLKPTAAPGDFDEGNDILVINPSTGLLVGRIDLLPFAVRAPDSTATLPRADRMVSVGNRVYVSLNNLSDDFQASGHGRVLVIDPATDAVVGQVDLPTLKNCGALTHHGNHLFVACGGVFADGAMQAAHSGIARIQLADNQVQILGSPAFANGLVSLFAVAAMDDHRIAAVTLGDFSGSPPDRLWGGNFATGMAMKGHEASRPYSLWSVVADRARGLVWATDGGAQPALRAFTMDAAGALTAGPVLKTSLTRKLSPREIAWY